MHLLVGAGERMVARLDRLGQRIRTLHQRRTRLRQILDLRVTFAECRLELRQLALERIAQHGQLHRAPVEIAQLFGARRQAGARLVKQLLGRGRARLQGLEAGPLRAELALMAFIGFVEHKRNPGAFGIGVGEI